MEQYAAIAPKTVTPHLLRQFFAGAVDMSTLPAFLVGQLQTIARRIERQHARAAKREGKAQAYARVGLNGKRAVARRLRQIAAGQLQVSL